MSPVTTSPEVGAHAPETSDGVPLRALHARLLENAALRRMRGLERLRSRRLDDAGYWLSAAPAAVRKASALREEHSFAPLP
ncbi:hypothetical protein [Brevundimonas sp.]|uniref:hypothetical protein n=1 Tax=Brevundimonas sp. TaxID=1871086 RepID=UPI002D626070|nr:hypothetical protein [Brevundimonas sp.]HYC96578.1 hypothetical protein [Brevundimonas sp.]